MTNPLSQDLEHILDITTDLWQEFRDQRIFITGGTGFFGCWLLESFIWANERFNLDSSVWVLTRNPEQFQKKVPHLTNHPAIKLYTGDVRSFKFPEGNFSYIIHAATEASIFANPLEIIDTTIAGTKHVLEFAKFCGVKKLLLTSSGAVYGQQPSAIANVSEEYLGAPDLTSPRSAYGEGKRVSELLAVLYAQQYGFEVKIARCFAFVGPYLPLDGAFAIANFIKNILDNEPIRIKGDGTHYRSYLYAADLMIWLWTILCNGKSGCPYNVGSERGMSLEETADAIADLYSIRVEIEGKPTAGMPIQRYVPDTQKALTELRLKQTVDFSTAIKQTMAWHGDTMA